MFNVMIRFVFTFFVLFIIPSSIKAQGFNEENNKNSVQIKTNYEDLNNWAAHPWKKDPSDSIPAPLKINFYKDSLVDVFFIHPTTYTQKRFTEWNATLDDVELNKKTDETSILYQASVFNESNRVFAPRYRQAHIQSFFIDEITSSAYFDIAYSDIKEAFEFYLDHYNNGRPIIIAGHSQGTKHAGRLLKDFFEGKPLHSKLVCAYLIGMPVPENYFSEISPCKDSSATGCFVSWRTFKKGYIPNDIKNEKFKSIVTNPLSWTLDEKEVGSEKNRGGVLRNFNKIIPGVVDAKIEGNVLWTCKPDIFGKI
ncbi:MAG: DUF3089 domain-containing protein, partial [Ferruginibacter sp.]|nr:DUF3089 domain-containing protein [Ferruginibacter sp.]